MLLCFDDRQFEELVKSLPIRARISNVMLVKDCPAIIAGRFGIGAPAAVAQCEELIACGIRRILAVGTAATISKDFHVGDVIICEKAYSDEGTSRHYFPGRKTFWATPGLVHDVQTCLEEKGLRCQRAAAWTTDAPYRETPERRDAFKAKGAGVVEMEASALYMLAAYRKIPVLTVLVVGDSIAGEKWEPHFKNPKIHDSLDQTGHALLAFLKQSEVEKQTVQKGSPRI